MKKSLSVTKIFNSLKISATYKSLVFPVISKMNKILFILIILSKTLKALIISSPIKH